MSLGLTKNLGSEGGEYFLVYGENEGDMKDLSKRLIMTREAAGGFDEGLLLL